MRAGLVIMLAMHATACGRIGFDGTAISDDGSVDPSAIAITVRGAPDDLDAGQPIANATVVVGSTVYTTDANGRVTAEVTGPTTIHVGYRTLVGDTMTDTEWRLYTLVDIPSGSSVAIGVVQLDQSFVTLSLDVPPVASATAYGLRGPLRCGIDGGGPTPIVTSTVNNCTGETIPLYAVALDNGTPLMWLDAGMHVVTEGAQYSTTATWQPFGTETIRFTGIPSSILIGGGLTYDAGPDDRILLNEGGDLIDTAGDHDTTFATFGLPVDAVRVAYTTMPADPQAFAVLADPAPAPVGGMRIVDPSRFVRIIDTFEVENSGAVTWSFVPFPRDPTAMIAELDYDTVLGVRASWFFTGPMTTRVEIPSLPSPLDEIAPTASTVAATVAGLTIEGRAYSDVAASVLDNLLRVGAFDDLPTGWALSLAQLGGTSRPAKPTRLEQLARRAISAAD